MTRNIHTTKQPVTLSGFQAVMKPSQFGYSLRAEVGQDQIDILEEESKYSIYIRKKDIVIPWKDFNKNMAISVEYDLNY